MSLFPLFTLFALVALFPYLPYFLISSFSLFPDVLIFLISLFFLFPYWLNSYFLDLNCHISLFALFALGELDWGAGLGAH